MQHTREKAIRTWSNSMLATAGCQYIPLGNDASFRKYFRVKHAGESIALLVDAPPDKEKPAAFIEITNRLLVAGVHVPRIYHADPEQGFLLVEDLGDDLYLDQIHHDNADTLYAAAIDTLIRIQGASQSELDAFDADEMRQEMQLFVDWLLRRHLGMKPDQRTTQIYEDAFDRLIENALEQSQTFVHRDFHSRNLLIPKDGDTPGVIDYQDAVVGPFSYDLVSLLKDCYLTWPQEKIRQWVTHFLRQYALATKNAPDEKTFMRWFDLMGMQRHFKASGIFARLYHRDRKSGYLKDIPRTLDYIRECAYRYREFSDLGNCLAKIPRAALVRQR